MAQGYKIAEAKIFISRQQRLFWAVEHTKKDEVTF